mgnify:CR=1 FL=1
MPPWNRGATASPPPWVTCTEHVALTGSRARTGHVHVRRRVWPCVGRRRRATSSFAGPNGHETQPIAAIDDRRTHPKNARTRPGSRHPSAARGAVQPLVTYTHDTARLCRVGACPSSNMGTLRRIWQPNPTLGLRHIWVHIAGMGGPLVTLRVASDPVVYEHTGSSVRPPKGVTYKQVLHPKQPYFDNTPIFKKIGAR